MASSKKSVQINRIIVENINVSGYTTTVDRPKYHAMYEALLKVLP
jgi:hypothetical protein